jgi:hypothetical protein
MPLPVRSPDNKGRMNVADVRSLAKVARLCDGVTPEFPGSVSATGSRVTTHRNAAGGRTDPMEETRAEYPLAPASYDG